MLVNLSLPVSQGNRQRNGSKAAYLGNPGSQVASDEKLVALKLSLDDDEGKVGLRIHVASQVLDFFNLSLESLIDALEEAIFGPAETFMSAFSYMLSVAK